MKPEEVCAQSEGQCAAGPSALVQRLAPHCTSICLRGRENIEGQFGLFCDYVTPMLPSGVAD